MFIASPQKWILMYFLAVSVYLVTFAKISFPFHLTTKPLVKSTMNLFWKW